MLHCPRRSCDGPDQLFGRGTSWEASKASLLFGVNPEADYPVCDLSMTLATASCFTQTA
jgi:hypothetical protein